MPRGHSQEYIPNTLARPGLSALPTSEDRTIFLTIHFAHLEYSLMVGTDSLALEEIKITPEMIEAGADVVWRAFGDIMSFGNETGGATAVVVFLAMLPLSPLER